MPSLFLQSHQIIRVGNQLMDLRQPRVMGILNITPDSFYDGGRYESEKALLQGTQQMIEEGVDIIDIGGYSSRPGADDIPVQEEAKRVIKAIRLIRAEFAEVAISIDTFRAEVAEAALSEGANMVNDISGGSLDAAMFETVAGWQVPYIMMHMRGNPQNMREQTSYQDILSEIVTYFEKKVHILRALGQKDIIIDPGFGFAKNIAQNYVILQNLAQLKCLGLTILVGLSRKSMIYKTLNTEAAAALNGTTALHMFALSQGANILRVHDVKPAKEVIKLWQAINGSID